MTEAKKYRYDRELGIVDEEGLQVLQLSTNYSTDDFKDRAGNLLAKALNEVADKAQKQILASLDKGAEAMKDQDADEQIVELKRDGFDPIVIQLMLRHNGDVFAFKGIEGERDGVYVCTANQVKQRPAYYSPGMRFRRSNGDEYVLVVGGFDNDLKHNFAMLINISACRHWNEVVKIANSARITRAEFDEITGNNSDEFELIEKEPTP